MLRLFQQELNEGMTLYGIKGSGNAKKNVLAVFKDNGIGVKTSTELAAVFKDNLFEVVTRDLFAAEFALVLKQILGHMEHNGGMASDNVIAGTPIRTQTAGMTHLQR